MPLPGCDVTCPECNAPELEIWSGDPKEFWAVLDRYIKREEIESDWLVLNEVLQLALLHIKKP
jgi:hypothetical protein